MGNTDVTLLLLRQLITRHVFSNAGLFISMTVGVKVAAALSNFVILAWLRPELIGIWQILAVVQAYASVLGLGIVSAMNRELPFYLGRGDQEQAERIAGTAYSHSILISILGLFIFGVYYCLSPSIDEKWTKAACAASLIWCFSNYRSYLEGTFRTGAQFGNLSRCQLVETAFGLATLPLVYSFGFDGFLVRNLLVASLGIGLLHILRPIKVKPCVNLESLQKLVTAGVPLFINAYLLSLANGVDRILLAGKGVDQVGLFAPVEAILLTMSTLPQAITSFYYPKMVFEFGKTGDIAKAKKAANLLTLVSVASSLIVAAICGLFVSVLIDRFLPQYSSIKSAAFIALVTGVLTAAHSSKILFYVLKDWTRLAVYTSCYGVSKLLFGFCCIGYFDDPVYGIAIACLCTASLTWGVTMALFLSIRSSD